MVACWMYPELSDEELKKICPRPKRLMWSVCFLCGYHGKLVDLEAVLE